MVRILRIISLICAAAVSAVVIPVLIFGFSPSLEIQNQLSQASVVEEYRNDSKNPASADDKESPLVIQARAFALRIDPPLPPVIITPKPPRPDPESLSSAKSHDSDNKPPPLPEFQLLGTASYTGHPEKSLALLNLASGGCRWVRQGESVDQATVGQIKDGKIILCRNGKKDQDLSVPKPQSSFKSLLKD